MQNIAIILGVYHDKLYSLIPPKNQITETFAQVKKITTTIPLLQNQKYRYKTLSHSNTKKISVQNRGYWLWIFTNPNIITYAYVLEKNIWKSYKSHNMNLIFNVQGHKISIDKSIINDNNFNQ